MSDTLTTHVAMPKRPDGQIHGALGNITKSSTQYQEAMLQKSPKRPPSIDASVDDLAAAVSRLYDTVEKLASKLQPILLPSGPGGTAQCSGDISGSPSHIRHRIDGMTDGVQSTIDRLAELTNEVDL